MSIFRPRLTVLVYSPSISHDAQPCYCGEDKCVGFIGGKTQTDIAAMDDLYLDGESTPRILHRNSLTICIALGITDEVEQLGLKGNKKKKSKKLDEDFVVSILQLDCLI